MKNASNHFQNFILSFTNGIFSQTVLNTFHKLFINTVADVSDSYDNQCFNVSSESNNQNFLINFCAFNNSFKFQLAKDVICM